MPASCCKWSRRRRWRCRRPSESDSKYVVGISGSCQAAGEQADACNQDPGFGAGNGCLEVFGEPPIAAEPSKRTLDDPASRLRPERSHALRAGDDFNRPLAQISDCIEQFWAAIDTV